MLEFGDGERVRFCPDPCLFDVLGQLFVTDSNACSEAMVLQFAVPHCFVDRALRDVEAVGYFFDSKHVTTPIRLCSKQSSFHLVSVNGPLGVGDFFSSVEFEVGAGTDLFDELTNTPWFAAVSGSTGEKPAGDGSVRKAQ